MTDTHSFDPQAAAAGARIISDQILTAIYVAENFRRTRTELAYLSPDLPGLMRTRVEDHVDRMGQPLRGILTRLQTLADTRASAERLVTLAGLLQTPTPGIPQASPEWQGPRVPDLPEELRQAISDAREFLQELDRETARNPRPGR